MGYAHAWCEQLSILGCRPWSRNNRNQLHGHEFALNGSHQLFKLSYWYTPTCYVPAFLSEYPVCNRRSTSFLPTPTPAPPLTFTPVSSLLSYQPPLHFQMLIRCVLLCLYDIKCLTCMILNAPLAWRVMPYLYGSHCFTCMLCDALCAWCVMLYLHGSLA